MGFDSRIELDALENFLSPPATSRLIITNGGALRLNAAGMVFSGVEIAVAMNTAGLPQTTLAATNVIL